MPRAMTQMRSVPCSGSGLSCFVSRLVGAWCLAPDLSCQKHQWLSFSDLTEGMQIKSLVFRILFYFILYFILCYVMWMRGEAWRVMTCRGVANGGLS